LHTKWRAKFWLFDLWLFDAFGSRNGFANQVSFSDYVTLLQVGSVFGAKIVVER